MKKTIILLSTACTAVVSLEANYPSNPSSGQYYQDRYSQEPYYNEYRYQDNYAPQGQIYQSREYIEQRRVPQYNNPNEQNRNVRNFDTDRRAAYNEGATQARPDGEIREKIRDELKPGVFSKGFENIQVEVINGRVLLVGVVNDEGDLKTIIDRVRKVKGVADIENRIRIQPNRDNR